MDHCNLNHRKRKAATDDRQDKPPDPSNAPRQPWLAADTDWASPSSPQVSSPLTSSTKRPRIDTLDSTLRGKPHQRRSPPTPLPAVRHGSDIEDIGIVSTADPGPSSGSLLRDRPSPTTPAQSSPRKVSILTESPIDFSSPHIPPMQPLINRQTLRELDLDIILRNPVLRHDLLFDPGLQFRPRRKREMSEKYWNALWEEVQTGCTCVTLDIYGKSHKTVCICSRHPDTPTIPIIYAITHSVYTLRLPSRIPALLTEFLEVMLFVIQPLSNTAVYTNPSAIKEQAQEHSAHAAHLRDIFDPALIYQEMKHKVFDPSGLFTHIGDTLKHHCAPMRDRAVEELVQFTQQPGVEAFKAFRTCLELLELMKLDIANHQLTQLRPWLLRNTGAFEIKAFKMRYGIESSLHNTRGWLHTAHDSLLTRAKAKSIPHPSYPNDIHYESLTKNQQIYLSALKAIVDIVFDASHYSPPSSPTSSLPSSPVSPPTTPSPVSSRPETLYLDKTRLIHLTCEAVDASTMYLCMHFFRQLAESGDGSSPVKAGLEDMLKLKQEIRDIGPSRVASCLIEVARNEDESGLSTQERKELEQRRSDKQDLVLQVARRASQLRHRGLDVQPQHPEPRILGVAQRWADTNMLSDSFLVMLMHSRMRELMFDAVVSLAYPASSAGSLSVDLATASANLAQAAATAAAAAGSTSTNGSGVRSLPSYALPFILIEPVMDEVRALAEKIARLALIHLNTYLPLYESEGFFSTR